MILILATALCLVITGTQSELLNGDRLKSPDHEERQVDVGLLIKVGKDIGKWNQCDHDLITTREPRHRYRDVFFSC